MLFQDCTSLTEVHQQSVTALSSCLCNPCSLGHVFGRKLVALFGLAQQMLTQQQHYDWGLRALKTCLALAGKLLREHRLASPGLQVADDVQTQLIVRSVWLATMPKLTFEDTARQACCYAAV